MKIIEILTENEKEDWATIQGYTPDNMKGRVSDKESANSFYSGQFKEELKKIIGFLDAWERLAFNTGYASKQAKQAKRDIGTILSTMDTNAASLTELHNSNLILVKKKLNDAALYFGSIARDFQDAGQSDMYKISLKIHNTLANVANEVEVPATSNVA